MKSKSYAWFDGKIVDEASTAIPILTHSVQYGSGIFEGLRAYKTKRGTAIFRLQDHMKRFLKSAKIYSMNLGYTEKELCAAVKSVVKKNGLESCYIRPFAFYNDNHIGLSTFGKKISVFIGWRAFGAYFGVGRSTGISCRVSSWRRINSEELPPEAKASGNYLNSIMANTEARTSGADEAILLSANEGHVAEGPGENVFLVQDGKLVTPSKDADILLGITRDSIIKIAKNIGIEVEERNVHREELDTCDELFFTGTAAEVTPITKIDSIKVGNGKLGPITKMLAERYSRITVGVDKEFEYWLTYI